MGVAIPLSLILFDVKERCRSSLWDCHSLPLDTRVRGTSLTGGFGLRNDSFS